LIKGIFVSAFISGIPAALKGVLLGSVYTGVALKGVLPGNVCTGVALEYLCYRSTANEWMTVIINKCSANVGSIFGQDTLEEILLTCTWKLNSMETVTLAVVPWRYNLSVIYICYLHITLFES